MLITDREVAFTRLLPQLKVGLSQVVHPLCIWYHYLDSNRAHGRERGTDRRCRDDSFHGAQSIVVLFRVHEHLLRTYLYIHISGDDESILDW